jgi:hypothetical protein
VAEKRKKWISKAITPSHKGEFRAKAEAAGKSTREFAKEHEHDSGKTGAQARLAETLMGMRHRKSKMYSEKSRARMNE